LKRAAGARNIRNLPFIAARSDVHESLRRGVHETPDAGTLET